MNGITVYLNGKWYWFESAEDLVEILDSNCNDAGYADGMDCVIEYDDQQRRMRMKHIERMVIREIRKSLEALEKDGVGYIDGEYTDTFYYVIDDVCISIRVDAEKKE